MTCIVGLIDKQNIWIGADSAGTDSNYVLTKRKDSKVFKNGPFLIGFTSTLNNLFLYPTKNIPPSSLFSEEDKNRLFKVEDDFQVGESICKFDSCGCGQEIALGSLYSTKNITNSRIRVLLALKSAEEFSGAVSKPFNIKKIIKNK